VTEHLGHPKRWGIVVNPSLFANHDPGVIDKKEDYKQLITRLFVIKLACPLGQARHSGKY